MPDSQRWIRRHWNRLQFGQFLGVCADYLAASLLTLGCIILLVKLFVPSAWPYALWLFALAATAPLFAWRKVQSKAYTQTEAAALLDGKLQAGGLLMTLSEAPDQDWQRHLPQIEDMWRNSLPRIRPKRFASLVTVPLAFAIATCFIPLRQSTPAQATPRKVSEQTTDELEAILKTLEESDVLEEEQKEELKKEIEKFAEETRDKPLTHEQWETADSLKQQMQMSWEKNERSLEAASSALEELMSSLANGGEASSEQIEQLEQALGENLESLARKAASGNMPGMSEELQKALQNMAENGKLNLPKDAEARKKAMQDLKERLKKESEELAKKRSECQGLCQGNGNCQGNSPGDGQGNLPGKGGVNRGRGDAAMYWGEESDLAGSKFKEVVLPPGILDDPSEELLGLTFKEPEAKPADSAPRQAVRENDPSAGRATWDRKLNPRHRDVVRKFFDSERKTEAIPTDAGL
ncbi:MAG: hypothetical protein CMJ47_06050 [Planctomyces sp.]|nr:hypothetical protein [Planctomyces sp.]